MQSDNNSGDKLDGGSPTKTSNHSSSGREVLDICASLLREYDSLAPTIVRQRL